MFKVRRFVCLALVCALVGVAYGAAHKIRSFSPMGAELETADGMAILNHAGLAGLGKTILQVVVSDFTPNTTYAVGVCLPYFSCFVDEFGQSNGAWIIQDAMTTDEHGNGTFHYEFPGDYTGDPGSSNVAIYLYLRDADGVVSAPPGGFLRALGNL